MKTRHLLPALLATCSVVTAGVWGQTLPQRIAAVKKRAVQSTAASQENTRLKLLQTLLYKKLTVSFERVPAREVFDYMRAALGINLIARYSDDPVAHGIDPQTPITLIGEGMLAVELLDLVLEQCSAVEPSTWQLRGSFVEVGTKERLSTPESQQIRVYAIDDLTYQPPRFENTMPMTLEESLSRPYGGYAPGPSYRLRPYGGGYGGYGGRGGYGGSIGPAVRPTDTIRDKTQAAESIIALIVEVIEPEAWTRNGGAWASIRYLDGALIVRAPDFIHRQINGYPRVPRPDRVSRRKDSPPKR